MPCARTRSFSGSQVVNALVTFGKQPASPAPKRNRVTASETKFQAQPVAAVKKLHHSTIRSEHAARSHAVAQVAAGNFEERVGPAERGKDRAHLAFIQAEIVGDERRGEGDGNAVDVGDHRQSDGENDHPIAYAGGALMLDHARASFMNW